MQNKYVDLQREKKKYLLALFLVPAVFENLHFSPSRMRHINLRHKERKKKKAAVEEKNPFF